MGRRYRIFILQGLVLLVALVACSLPSPCQQPASATTVQAIGSCRILRSFVPVSNEVLESLVIKKVQPDSPLFKTAHVEATIPVHIFVGRSGTVVCARSKSDRNPFLVMVSLQAAMKWKFKPYLDTGVSSPIQGEIVFVIDI